MRRNTFIALVGVAVLAIAGAGIAIQQRQEAGQAGPARQVFVPGLLDRVNAVTRVTIRSAESSVNLERTDDRWVMPDKAGYPVDFEKLRRMLLNLARIETVERRTTKPELYSKLQVEDVDAPDAKSVQVTVHAGDELLADVIIGRTRPTGEGGGLFVRRVGEEQAWLAEGELRPDRQLVSWLDRNIVNVDQRRIWTVTITHADGERVVVAKDQPAPGDYSLRSPIPEERQPKPAYDLSALPSITDFLILEDVRPASELDFATPAVTGEFVSYDGLRLIMDAIEDEGTMWVRVKADTVEPHPEAASFVSANAGKDSAEGRTADLFKTVEEVAAEAETINARTSGWAYRLTDFKTGKLRSRIEDLTQPVETNSQEKPAAGVPAAPTNVN